MSTKHCKISERVKSTCSKSKELKQLLFSSHLYKFVHNIKLQLIPDKYLFNNIKPLPILAFANRSEGYAIVKNCQKKHQYCHDSHFCSANLPFTI